MSTETLAHAGFPITDPGRSGDEADPGPATRRTPTSSEAAPDPPPLGETAARSSASDWLLGSRSSAWPDEARRLAVAASLTAVFGVSLGLRHGGLALAWGAAGAPLGILAVALLAAPALAIVLALANAPVGAMDLARATTRGAAKAGLLLAGLSPAAALFVVTVEDAITVSLVGFGALVLAGIVAARSFQRDLDPQIAEAGPTTRAVLSCAVWGFLVFAAILALRVWSLGLPMLTVLS